MGKIGLLILLVDYICNMGSKAVITVIKDEVHSWVLYMPEGLRCSWIIIDELIKDKHDEENNLLTHPKQQPIHPTQLS